MKKFTLIAITLLISQVGFAGERFMEVPTTEKYEVDGIDLKHEKWFAFGIRSFNSDNAPQVNFAEFRIHPIAFLKFFKKQKAFDDLPLDKQMVRLFGAEHGTYANFSPINTVSDSVSTSQVEAEVDLPEANRRVADTNDREENTSAERGRYHIGNNLPTWATGAAAVTGGVLGYNAISDDGGDGTDSNDNETKNNRVSLRGIHAPVTIFIQGSGSGSENVPISGSPSAADSDHSNNSGTPTNP